MLTGFKPINLITGSAVLSVTNNGLGFNKNVSIKMDNPTYIRFMINDDEKQIAIQKSDGKDDSSTKFVQEGTDITNGIRYHNKDLEAIIESMMQWDLSLYNYRIDGYYQEEDSAMIFNLKSARRFPKRSRTNK